MIKISDSIKVFTDKDIVELANICDSKIYDTENVIKGQFKGLNIDGNIIQKNSYANGGLDFIFKKSSNTTITERKILILKTEEIIERYFFKYMNTEVSYEIESMWLIQQKEGDYAAIHNHLPNDYSGILYLECPEGVNSTTYPNGIMNIIDENQIHSMPPIPGTIYFWPSSFLHLVYPFKGFGCKKAISFNLSLI